MKNRFIEIVALILGILTTVTGVLTLPHVSLLPASWQPYVALALGLVVVGKNGAYVVLDFSDDGKLNQSYKLPPVVKTVLLLGCCLCLMSCANPVLGVNKQGWGDILRDVGKGALQGALNSALPSYQREREETAAKTAYQVQP